jgi:hypothetical protein
VKKRGNWVTYPLPGISSHEEKVRQEQADADAIKRASAFWLLRSALANQPRTRLGEPTPPKRRKF